MWILLAFGFLVPFIYIGYLLSRLDEFLAQNITAIEGDKASPAAIVLGGTVLAEQISDLLAKNDIKVLYLTEPFLIERGQNFRYLFALSENDADNIVLCKIGKKVYDIKNMISICNDRRNEAMFASQRIRYLLRDGITAQMLYTAAAQDTEVEL